MLAPDQRESGAMALRETIYGRDAALNWSICQEHWLITFGVFLARLNQVGLEIQKQTACAPARIEAGSHRMSHDAESSELALEIWWSLSQQIKQLERNIMREPGR